MGGSCHAIDLAREDGPAFVWLSVWEHNPNAISLYQHKGFTAFDENSFCSEARSNATF